MKIFLKRIDARLRKSSKRERIVKRIGNQFEKNLKPICDTKRENRIRHTAGTLVLFPAGNYMFKVNNRNTRARCEICSKLTINIPERRQRLWTYFTRCSSVPIVNFEHVNTGCVWEKIKNHQVKTIELKTEWLITIYERH